MLAAVISLLLHPCLQRLESYYSTNHAVSCREFDALRLPVVKLGWAIVGSDCLRLSTVCGIDVVSFI